MDTHVTKLNDLVATFNSAMKSADEDLKARFQTTRTNAQTAIDGANTLLVDPKSVDAQALREALSSLQGLVGRDYPTILTDAEALIREITAKTGTLTQACEGVKAKLQECLDVVTKWNEAAGKVKSLAQQVSGGRKKFWVKNLPLPASSLKSKL
jgi:hypothetical protein